MRHSTQRNALVLQRCLNARTHRRCCNWHDLANTFCCSTRELITHKMSRNVFHRVRCTMELRVGHHQQKEKMTVTSPGHPSKMYKRIKQKLPERLLKDPQQHYKSLRNRWRTDYSLHAMTVSNIPERRSWKILHSRDVPCWKIQKERCNQMKRCFKKY